MVDTRYGMHVASKTAFCTADDYVVMVAAGTPYPPGTTVIDPNTNYVLGVTDGLGNLAGLNYGQSQAVIGSLRRSSVMFLGDSNTNYGVSLRNLLLPDAALTNTPSATYTTLNAVGLFVRNTQFDMRYTPAGAGTLRYYAADTTMTWQSFGEGEGARVSVSTGGSFYLPARSRGGAYVQLVIANKPTGNAADAITPTTTVVNSWGYINGYAGAWEVYNGNPFDVTYNIAVSGCTSSDAILWQNQWNQIYSDITVIALGTNDTATIANNAVILANIQNIVAQRRLIGSIPIVCGILPNSTGTLANKQANLDLNQQLAVWCRANGVRYCDPQTMLADWTTQNPGVRTNAFGVDGLHTSGLGGYLYQKYVLGPQLNPLVQNLAQLNGSANSVYHATNAPRENLLTNGGLAGTQASAGTGASGTQPTSWSVSRTSGATVTVVSTAPADGGLARTDGPAEPWWKLVIDNTGGLTNNVIGAFGSSFVSASNYAVGDKLVFTGELSIAVTTTGMVRPEAVIVATNITHKAIGATTGFELFDQYGKTEVFRFRSRPFTVPPAGIANLNVNLNFFMQADGVATIGIGPLALTKM